MDVIPFSGIILGTIITTFIFLSKVQVWYFLVFFYPVTNHIQIWLTLQDWTRLAMHLGSQEKLEYFSLQDTGFYLFCCPNRQFPNGFSWYYLFLKIKIIIWDSSQFLFFFL